MFTRPKEWVVDCHRYRHYSEYLPLAICPRSFRQSWVKLRAEFMALELCFIPPLFHCPEKWVIEKKQKMGLDSTKTYASFYALIKNINNRKNVSFQSVLPWQWWSSHCHSHQMRALPGPEPSSFLARFLPSWEETQALKDTTSLWRGLVSKATFLLHGFWATNSKATCGKK